MMTPDRKVRDMIREASAAHCDLNILYGVIAILEGGTISAECNSGVQRIIKICKDQSAKCLVRYDRASLKIATLTLTPTNTASNSVQSDKGEGL